jgi:hypothetical protein
VHSHRHARILARTKVKLGHRELPRLKKKTIQYKRRSLALDANDQKVERGTKITSRFMQNRKKLREIFAQRSQSTGGVERLFQYIDTNNSGHIDIKEFRVGLARMGLSYFLEDAEYMVSSAEYN